MTAIILGAVGLFLASAALVMAVGLFLRGRGDTGVVTRAIRSLPGLGRRALSRGAGHRAWLGCVDYGHRFLIFTEDLVTVWPPHAGNSPRLAEWILSQSGSEPTDITRPDPREFGEEGGAS
jgi:hypothetical protein